MLDQWLAEWRADKTLKPEVGEAVAIVLRAYGVALEQKAASGCAILDANKLPFPKDAIKNSLIIALMNSKNEKVKEHMKVGLMFLPDWQDGVGAGVKTSALSPASYDGMSDIDKLNAIAPLFHEHKKWLDVSFVESQRIKDELVAAGLW